MLDAAFQHLRGTGNVGDDACCPAAYFDFGETVVQGYGQPMPPARLAIFGGGQTFRQAAQGVILDSPAARHRVVWGVGITARQARSFDFDLMRGSAALVGSRVKDTPGCDFVPCVSAMSPRLDTPSPARVPVVLFWHAGKSDALARPAHVPARSNQGVTLAQAIEFLAMGETVVTNSYHGTFWAMCLGRKVLCLPFSDKFDGFLDAPATAAPEDWPDNLHRARRHGETLGHARSANRGFHDRVMNLA